MMQLDDEQQRKMWAAFKKHHEEHPNAFTDECLYAAGAALLEWQGEQDRKKIAQLQSYVEWLKDGYRQIAKGMLPQVAKDDLYRRFALDRLSGPPAEAFVTRPAPAEARRTAMALDSEQPWTEEDTKALKEALSQVYSNYTGNAVAKALRLLSRPAPAEGAVVDREIILAYTDPTIDTDTKVKKILAVARRELIERIAVLEAENAELKHSRDVFAKGLENEETECNALHDVIDALKAPVSVEEWGVIYDKAPSWVQGYLYLRAKIDALIAARAKETL